MPYYAPFSLTFRNVANSKKKWADYFVEAIDLICDNISAPESRKDLKKLAKDNYLIVTLKINTNNPHPWFLNEEELIYETSPIKSGSEIEVRNIIDNGMDFITYKGICSGISVSIKEVHNVSDERRELFVKYCKVLRFLFNIKFIFSVALGIRIYQCLWELFFLRIKTKLKLFRNMGNVVLFPDCLKTLKLNFLY